MGLRINNNIESFNAHRSLSITAGRLAKSMERLSSGFRINRAGDDAAGLGISEKMRGQISGIAQAQRNAQDGISLVQTAEGAMQEIHSILHRVRELAVQYQNGTNGTEARAAITAEVAQLSAELGRMIGGAQFNGIKLLDGSGGSISLQVGPNASASDTLAFPTVNLLDVPAGTTNALSAVMTNFNTGTMTTVLADLDAHINAVSGDRAAMGAIQNRLEYTTNALGIAQENLMAAESRIRDVDMAQEMTTLARMQILQESSIAMLAQANATQSQVLKLLS